MGIADIIQKLGGKKVGKISKQWEFQADSALLTTPVVADFTGGRKAIVFGTKNGKVYSLDEESKVRWLYDVQDKKGEIEMLFLDEETVRSIRCPPSIADINNDGKNEVIVSSDTGLLLVISESGKLLWQFKANAPIRSSALVADINGDGKKEILFGCNDKFMYALDCDGKMIWRYSAEAAIESPGAVLERKSPLIVFGSDDGTVYCLNADGTLRWKFKTQSKITAQPVIADFESDGKVLILIGSLDNYLYAIDEFGALVWKFKTEGSIYSKVCLADINKDKKLEVIFGSCDNSVYALTSKGEKIWSYETDFWVVASPFVVDFDNDGRLEVVAGSYDHSLYVLDAEGTFILNYMPGVAGIAQQPGQYTTVMNSQPGQYLGKKLWEYKTGSFIVGSTLLEHQGRNHIIVGTKEGKLRLFTHEKE